MDSEQMYEAYLTYRYETFLDEPRFFIDRRQFEWRPEWWEHLDMYLHKNRSGPPGIYGAVFAGVKLRDCEQRACSRCEKGLGGFQFNWYSRYWAKTYNDKRREGTWKAPEPTVETSDDPSLRFWERPEGSF